ncbi:MAG: RNA ligase RtcB family protein [Deltaproteobacteria bacterium]|nr:RNA ligase RtcB family protein [Deltaproteobacteria bacterium]
MNNAKRITLLTTPGTWIEGESLRQLERVASFSGMMKVVGFPDLFPGKGIPVGAAMLTEGEFYPHLVGSDVGCGISLFATGLTCAKAKPEKWFKKLKGLEEPWDGDAAVWLEERSAQPVFLDAAGTIGHGNHFAELVRIGEIKDRELSRKMRLDEDALFLIVHSGSRGLGESLLRSHTDRFKAGSLKMGSDEAFAYLAGHNNAVLWARANRELIAHRFLEQLHSGYRKIVDCCHNSLTPIDNKSPGRFLHRKGAAASDSGAVIIPGSRGSYSYLVTPIGDQEHNLWSVAHGAGRKWIRSECKGRLRERYRADSLTRTKLGSYVICEDKELLYEEAPQAYKDIESVIGDMVSFGLVRVIASFSPLLTYKVRER